VSRRSGAAVAVAAAVVAATVGFTATKLDRASFAMYDEGVYYYQAVVLVRGGVPYREFFCPQPPGILLLGAASEGVGAGLTGVRAVNWLCGLVLLVQTYRLTRRLAGPDARAAAAVAAALVAATVPFAYQSIHGATNMPAACLELAACLLVLGDARGRFALAGLVLGAATALRLPSAVAVPGALVLVRFAHGREGYWPRVAWFLGPLAVAGGAIHLGLAAAVPGYADNVVGFQTARVRTDWADRGGQVVEFLQEPVTAAGLAAALGFAALGSGRRRGVALHALVTAGVITVAGNSLSSMYYLPVLPLFAACATAGAVRLFGPEPRALVAVAAGAAVRAWWVATAVIGTMTASNADHAACVARLRGLTGETVLTSDGRIAVLAGKRAVPDYYATDPNALHLVAPDRFHAWFAEWLPKADVVVVTPQLWIWMSPANAAAVRTCGKPVLFDTDGTRATFETNGGPVP
jgi:hypothetical protein